MKSLTIEKKNSRLVEISTPFNIVEHYNNKKLTSLELSGDIILKINEYFKVTLDGITVNYKIREIVKKSEGSYTLVSYNRNRTTSYLLPCLGLTHRQLFYSSYFINAYLDIDKYSLNGKFIYLAYRYVRGEKYRKFESLITTYSNYYKTIDVSPNLVVYAFTIPKEFWEDIDRFKQAKYSQFSNKLKERIKISNGIESTQYKVVTQNPNYILELENFLEMKLPINIELDSIPNINDETLIDYD